MATQTTVWKLYKPTVNGDDSSWGVYLNYNQDRLETHLTSITTRIDNVVQDVGNLVTVGEERDGTLSDISGQIESVQTAQAANATAHEGFTDRLDGLDTQFADLYDTVAGISSSVLGTGVVVSDYLATGSVVTAKIADDAVTAAKLAAQAVDSTALGNDSVLSRHIKDAQIGEEHIKGNAVTQVHIVAGAVSTEQIHSLYTLVPKPGERDGDKVLYNDDVYGLRWKRQNKVIKVANYTKLFQNTEEVEPGDLLVLINGGSAAGGGANDYPTQINGEPTPISLDATSVFLANIGSPSKPSDYTTLYTGQNGVLDVQATNTKATFYLQDGTNYEVPLPQFNINELNQTDYLGLAEGDYTVTYDSSSGQQKKVKFQDLRLAFGWGATVIEGGGGGGGGTSTGTTSNGLGIVLGIEVNTLTGQLVMNTTGGFNQDTAYINNSGHFILVG